jgi:Predicted membrane protein
MSINKNKNINKNGNKNEKKKDANRNIIIAIGVILLVIIAFGMKSLSVKQQMDAANSDYLNGKKQISVVKDQDMVIPLKEITEKAQFYPAEINGTKLEVIAVKASDGTIRTAFNTCQVCYSSGKGYYKQENGKLVCQNCGNTFGMDDVAVTRGGCNPVPITDEYKTVDKNNITISKDTLIQATEIFANWKS